MSLHTTSVHFLLLLMIQQVHVYPSHTVTHSLRNAAHSDSTNNSVNYTSALDETKGPVQAPGGVKKGRSTDYHPLHLSAPVTQQHHLLYYTYVITNQFGSYINILHIYKHASTKQSEMVLQCCLFCLLCVFLYFLVCHI